jgi:rubrerythrin
MSEIMKNFRSIRDILDFAISREIEANKFYEQLSYKVEKPEIQNKLSYFAIDEFQHKIRLEAVRDGDEMLCQEEVGSLNIADYVDDIEPRADMTYIEILALAMNREKTSFKLYSNLAAISKHQETKDVFLLLEQEEAKHKLHLEVEYDLATF